VIRAVIIAIAVALAAPAAAQPAPSGTAAEHYERGRRLYDVASYQEAIAEFKLAYTLEPDPSYLFNIAQAYRLDGDCAAAADFFKRFLKADPTSDRRTKIAKLNAECKPREQPVEPPVVTPDTGARPTPEPPPAPPPDPGKTRRIVGLVTAIGGGVLLATGGALAYNVSSLESQIEDACSTQCDWEDVRGLDDKAHTRSTLSTVAFITGGAAVIGGTALYLWGRRMTREARVAIIPTSDGAFASAAFDF
jgi:tetratricopeptide (TPR) repeat protein